MRPPALRRPRHDDALRQLRADVDALLADLDRAVRDRSGLIARAAPSHRGDAENLVRYVALRQRDQRRLQRALADRGLSSLGRCEPHVLANVTAVRDALAGASPRDGRGVIAGFAAGRAALDANTDALFGPRPEHRVTRVMVTQPSEAATDYALVRTLAERGMDVARINAAHDGPAAWRAMAAHVRKAGRDVGRPVQISLDLPGPKLRTGTFVSGPRVLRLRPVRDVRGVVVRPARVRLAAAGPAQPGQEGALLPLLPLPADWLARRAAGETVRLIDSRGARRRLTLTAVDATGCTAEAEDTTYVETGTLVSVADDAAPVGDLPPHEQFHVLRPGDCLWLTADPAPAEPWSPGSPGEPRLGCSLPDFLAAVRVGDRVLLDDGKIATVVERTETDRCRLRVLVAAPNGSKLRAEKGINAPDTVLPVPVLGPADEEALRVAVEIADLVALSFLRSETDIDVVQDRLHALGAPHLGLVLKIETQAAFERLPEILLHGMRSERLGVMIARGDLAVEVGYERLAEVQEEILWVCEAAHLPVIWATEVLDHLARTGRPSRAEVTDAAMAQRAECVMLNKGPYAGVAITVLEDILQRMSGHQRKKTALLRPLRSWIPTGPSALTED